MGNSMNSGIEKVPNKNYKEINGITIYKFSTLNILLGCIGFFIGVFLPFLPDPSNSNPVIIIVLSCFFGLLGIRCLLRYLVSRVYTDSEKITFRNMIGISKSILWTDVDKIIKYEDVDKRSSLKKFTLFGNKKSIRIPNGMSGFDHLKSILRENCANAKWEIHEGSYSNSSNIYRD